MRNQKILQVIALCVAVMLLTAGCISYSRSHAGEKEFWGPWLETQVPSSSLLAPDESWKKFESEMYAWLTGKIGTLNEDEAQKMFSKPTQRRVTESARSEGWFYSSGKVLDWEALIISGNKGEHNDYILVLGFNPNGILTNFEIASSQNPSTTFGGTTKHLVEVGATVGGAVLFARLMEGVLNRAGDHFINNLNLQNSVENGVKNGVSGVVIPKEFTAYGGTFNTTIEGRTYNIVVPPFNGSLR